MTAKFRRATATAATGLGLCLTFLPAGQAQAHAPQAPTRVPCNDVAALKTAITSANTNGRGIVLAPRCTYFLTAADNADDGLPEITGNVRVSGGEGTTIRRAPGTSAFRIFHVKQGGGLSLESLTVRGGESAPVSASDGGGIYSERGTVRLTDVTVRSNTSSGLGGGIASLRGRLLLKDTTVRDNSASWGGGVGTSGTMTMRGGALSDNEVSNWGGGLANGGGTQLDHVSVDDNVTGQLGGGIATMAVNDESGPLRMNFTRVRGNIAQIDGGGMYLGADEPTTLFRSSVSRNVANGGPGKGGGIANPGVSLDLHIDAGTTGKRKQSTAAQTGFEVNLVRSAVFKNTPTDCAPPGSVPRCDAVGSAPGKNTTKPGRS
ncbi:hypothetical protein G4Z16_09670 [Streptomyces bathyalis]|uniref:Right handed beta helix domain-containing protein n=1 Tax=Streptomyces bathyalis TaxID=2710756 RepID=A0A7T1WQA3_9ACTN|nr:hypothetical protein [Streptomyces bathyalis]QPP06623.1 hypothetical protein G4Z16_09670 [Streptomyces bathyalis]